MYFHMIWSAPLQIALAMYLLWQVLGVSSLAGLGVMVLMIPLNGYIARKTRQLQVKQMAQKDSRIKEVNEVCLLEFMILRPLDIMIRLPGAQWDQSDQVVRVGAAV